MCRLCTAARYNLIVLWSTDLAAVRNLHISWCLFTFRLRDIDKEIIFWTGALHVSEFLTRLNEYVKNFTLTILSDNLFHDFLKAVISKNQQLSKATTANIASLTLGVKITLKRRGVGCIL